MTMIDSCNKSHSPLKVTDNSCSVEKTCTTNACNKSHSPQKATDNSFNIEKPSTTDAASNKSHSLQKQTDNSCNVQKPTTTNAEDLQNLLSELEKLNDKRIGIMKGFDVYVCHSNDPPSIWNERKDVDLCALIEEFKPVKAKIYFNNKKHATDDI